MAENHPVGFRWPMLAKQRGAKIVHIDPRFTRTSAVSDIYAPIRAGSDIAFLGGLIRYVLVNERYFKEYVQAFTNAAVVISDEFQDSDDLDGLFSGWEHNEGQYATDSWSYKGVEHGGRETRHVAESHAEKASHFRTVQPKKHERDETLEHPHCVFQLLKRHYERYTPEMVEEVCGVPPALFEKIARTICDNSNRERTTAYCYAVGWTQHTTGPQIIRACSILQLLLGNIGRPGGGIMALRGHATIQGSTDIPTLYSLLPGYLPQPKASADTSLQKYIENYTPAGGWWTQFPNYIVSLLKAWYGERATAENDYCFSHLPRMTGDHSHMTTVARMADGGIKGYFVMGENAVVGSPNAALQRKGLRNLEWLVVRDFSLIETAEFWRNSPEHTSGEVRTEEIGTEVFFFPAATHTEKNGSFTQTQRIMQWHHAAIEPPGDARSELHFAYHLGKRLKELYADSTEVRDRAIQDLKWDYRVERAIEEPSAEDVLAEINGYTVADGKPVDSYTKLESDGSTACGCWLYSGAYAGGKNHAASREVAIDPEHYGHNWGFAWPANRRILYNRASADPEGRPWSERKKLVWWDDAQKKWTGNDVPDFIVNRPPDYRVPDDAKGLATIAGDDPFIMQPDGKGWLFAPTGLLDGPLPTHYEPLESPVRNPLYGQQCNPVRFEYPRRENKLARPYDDPRFPHVLTTYRLTEQHTSGAMSRWLSWLAELQPEMFCEISPELAQEVGVRNGDWATINSARGEIEARVLVTERVRPLKMGRRTVHQIGLPYHWGATGLVKGDAANELLAFGADANVSIMESKAIMGNIRAGRCDRKTSPMSSGAWAPGDELRDSLQAGTLPTGKHQVRAPRAKLGDQT
jgi:formate dehydrogenase major subunit